MTDVGYLPPSYLNHHGEDSYFNGEPPLSLGAGFGVVLGFGIFFSVVATIFVYINKTYGQAGADTSEHFNTAGRLTRTGLTASVIVSNWTWAATLLQSSNVAWQYGVSGPFWYASGATIQILLFGVLAVRVKKVCPSAHTVGEIVYARWGKVAHLSFLCFFFATNMIVTSMLLLGGAATVQALTGMDYILASFLMPWGVIIYTVSGGLQATFLASYIHTLVIYVILVIMVFLVYIKIYSSDQIYNFLANTASKTPEQCEIIFATDYRSFYEPGLYACGAVPGNKDGSYLTMISQGGLMFGIINIVGNFGTVFVDQSYWQSAIAAGPTHAAGGYLLGGICWFAIPFSLATSLGLCAVGLMLPITSSEAGAGLVPAAVATELIGKAGSVLILIMLFMAIVSTGAAECIAVSSLITYDIYRQYMNPGANGGDILFVSRVMIVLFGLFMGVFSIILYEIGLNLGWVYLFMGIVIGSAVAPLWNLLMWKKASGTGAVVACWAGLVLAVIGWVLTAWIQSGEVTIKTLGTNEAMLTGNLISILSAGAIHYGYSVFIDPQDYNFDELEMNIHLVEDDLRGLSPAERNPKVLRKQERWINRRAYTLTIILVVMWPVLAVPAGVFSKAYFAFWVTIAISWAVGAALVMAILPITESSDVLGYILDNVALRFCGRTLFDEDDEESDDEDEGNRANNMKLPNEQRQTLVSESS